MRQEAKQEEWREARAGAAQAQVDLQEEEKQRWNSRVLNRRKSVPIGRDERKEKERQQARNGERELERRRGKTSSGESRIGGPEKGAQRVGRKEGR